MHHASTCDPRTHLHWFVRNHCGPFRHGPPPWVREMVGQRRRRAERGEVRYLILDAIRDEPRHGYDIMQTIESKTNGAYRPSPGTVYPTLQMLEELSHVRTKEADGRRLYEITKEGLEDLKAHQDEVDDAYDRLGEDDDWEAQHDIHSIFERFPRMVRLIARAFRRGRLRAKQIREIESVIDEACNQIENIVRGKRQ